jgi:hypothetical protein
MTIFPTLSQEQRTQLASMSPKDLLAAADEHEGEARWQQLQANALRELANDGRRSETAVTKRAPGPGARRTTSRKSPAGGATGDAHRLPDDLTREDLPKFAMPRREDPTGQKELMLGVMWITRDLRWSAPEIDAELKRTEILVLKSHMAITFLDRMATSGPPWVIKHGQGRDTRFQIAPDVRPIEEAANPALQDGDHV